MNIIENLKWRYATKKFNPSKKIPADQLNDLKEVIQLSPSSYGLQLFKVLHIVDPEMKKKLLPFSWNQSQVVDADQLFVFCNIKSYEAKDIEGFALKKGEIQNKTGEQIEAYQSFLKAKLSSITQEDFSKWSAKQIYIALGNLLTAAAEMKIDACPMEGFEVDEYAKILKLEDNNLEPAVVVALGYRADEDHTQHLPKVRREVTELFEVVE